MADGTDSLYMSSSFYIHGFILVSTIVICAKNAYVGNMWSETAAILGYSGAGQVVALLVP